MLPATQPYQVPLALGNTTAEDGPGHLNMSGNLVAGGNITGTGLTEQLPSIQEQVQEQPELMRVET